MKLTIFDGTEQCMNSLENNNNYLDFDFYSFYRVSAWGNDVCLPEAFGPIETKTSRPSQSLHRFLGPPNHRKSPEAPCCDSRLYGKLDFAFYFTRYNTGALRQLISYDIDS